MKSHVTLLHRHWKSYNPPTYGWKVMQNFLNERKLISNVLSRWCVHKNRKAAHRVILGEPEGWEPYHCRLRTIVSKHVVICGGYIIIVFAYAGNVLLDTSSGRFFNFVLTSGIGFLKKKNQNQRTPWWLVF